MQLTLDFDFRADNLTPTLLWLKNWQWHVIYRWHHSHINRRLVRSSRIVDKSFPKGISQADFMKTIIHERRK